MKAWHSELSGTAKFRDADGYAEIAQLRNEIKDEDKQIDELREQLQVLRSNMLRINKGVKQVSRDVDFRKEREI